MNIALTSLDWKLNLGKDAGNDATGGMRPKSDKHGFLELARELEEILGRCILPYIN